MFAPTTHQPALAEKVFSYQLPHRLRVSIILVNYNGRFYLDTCLQSLEATTGPDVEIIFIDNGSTDGSAAYVGQQYKKVKVIHGEENLGFGGGNNLGAQIAQGTYLVFLNLDTAVTPGWLETLITALKTNPQAALATPKILLLDDPTRINTGGNDIHISGLTLCRGMGLHRDELVDTAEIGAISGAAFIIRRDIFKQLGGFDADFFMYVEDTDLSWRANLAGYRCLYVPEAIVYHDYRLRFGPDKTYYQERNRYLMLLKGLRWRTLFLLLPVFLLAELITWGFVLWQDRARWPNKLRAYAYIGQYWRAIIAQRKPVQVQRRVGDREILHLFTHRLAYEQTGNSLFVRLAHLLFDPIFFIYSLLVRAIIWW